MKRPDLMGLAEIFAQNPDLQRRNPHLGLTGPQRGLEPIRVVKWGNGIAEGGETPPTRTKYRNEPTVVEGIRFDSKKEAARYAELQLLERAGEIKHLERQVRISLDINGVHICDYICDARYQEKQKDGTWRIVIEDTKGFITKEYKLKKKLVRALMGIEIRET